MARSSGRDHGRLSIQIFRRCSLGGDGKADRSRPRSGALPMARVSVARSASVSGLSHTVLNMVRSCSSTLRIRPQKGDGGEICNELLGQGHPREPTARTKWSGCAGWMPVRGVRRYQASDQVAIADTRPQGSRHRNPMFGPTLPIPWRQTASRLGSTPVLSELA